LDIAPGDRIFLYTDGLVEGKMDAIWSRGAEKLLAIVPECKIIPLKTMAEELYHKVYSTDKNQSDDIVVLGIEV